MLIAVVSDTHGNTELICRRLQPQKPDMLIFAGDYFRDGEMIARNLKIDFLGVRGNCDRDAPGGRDEETAIIINKKFYVLHGHQYGVKHSVNRLYYRALEMKADVVIYGHTHFPHLEQIDRLWMINPGSAARPRSSERGSYVMIEMENDKFLPRLVYI